MKDKKIRLTLNAICSKKCAVPLFALVSYLLPASIHNPTVHVDKPESSEAILKPFANCVTLVSGVLT